MKAQKLAASSVTAYAVLACIIWALDPAPPDAEPTQGWTLTAWNDLGMHCMDEDFSVFAILPPFNTINAQLIDLNGNPVSDSGGIQLFYQSESDPDGSETHSSSTGTNFWEHAEALFGDPLADDTGLSGAEMPGSANTPREMHWDADHDWWTREGIPIIPTDKFGDRQAYPLIRVTARNASGDLLAETMVTAPVSDEMNCKSCHGSNTNAAAIPPSGWINDPDPIRDYRLNILRLHDGRRLADPTTSATYAAALDHFDFNAGGLEATVVDDQKPILCASCHASNALLTDGFTGVRPLTNAMHSGHVNAPDPVTSQPLGASTNRTSCYQCHPGKTTRCLRGAMGRTSDDLGQPLMSCQSCHGGMTEVGDDNRNGWFDEPNCQSCHVGTHNDTSGPVRFTDSFVSPGVERQPDSDIFATNPDTPAAGVSLFRFSHGHGGLACSACHGSPHAIYPTSERNDNLQSLAVQGHVGTISECSSCHQNDTANTRTVTGGPHGMHGVGNWWVEKHHDHVPEHNDSRDATACKACHGLDLKGSVLSQALAPRTVRRKEDNDTITYWQGQRVSCWDCHRGPNESDPPSHARPVVQDFSITTAADTTAAATLLGSDADTGTLDYRIVSPPANGTLAIEDSLVSYTPNPGFAGTDSFTYCARDNYTDSNLGRVHIEVGPGANTVDNDRDGIPDLIERAFGLSTSRLSRGNAPDWRIHDDGAGHKSIQAIYDPQLVPPDLELIFEASTDLHAWDDTAANLATSSDARGHTVVRLALPPTGPPKGFVRCRVTEK